MGMCRWCPFLMPTKFLEVLLTVCQKGIWCAFHFLFFPFFHMMSGEWVRETHIQKRKLSYRVPAGNAILGHIQLPRKRTRKVTLPCQFDRSSENMASGTPRFLRRVFGEVSLSISGCQLCEPLPKRTANGAMVPDANENPNYFRQTIEGWHCRYLGESAPGVFMPNLGSSLREIIECKGSHKGTKNEMVMDRQIDGWRKVNWKREREGVNQTMCGLEEGQDRPSVTRKELQ